MPLPLLGIEGLAVGFGWPWLVAFVSQFLTVAEPLALVLVPPVVLLPCLVCVVVAVRQNERAVAWPRVERMVLLGMCLFFGMLACLLWFVFSLPG